MSALASLWPTPSEEATLRFLIPRLPLRARPVLSAALFVLGLLLWFSSSSPSVLGLLLILAGHLPIWVRRQTTAPGGATPKHEEIWAPVEANWLERVAEHERRGEAWDATPWDLSNLRGCGLLALVLFVGSGIVISISGRLGAFAIGSLVPPSLVLVVPLWLSGLRTTWNPSELKRKGQALAIAGAAATAADFEPVPLLALREGKRGKYPVDARLQLRPAGGEETRFLGIQFQVAMNNVRGTDYPYLYAVVLGKAPFELPAAKGRHRRAGGHVELVFEKGENEGVSFLVIRQHADQSGGWHTEPAQIQEIAAVALAEARAARDREQPRAARDREQPRAARDREQPRAAREAKPPARANDREGKA